MADADLAQHTAARSSFALECLHSVLREIAEAASDSEVTGVLLGTRDENRIRILSFRRLVPKRALGRSGALSEADLDAVARLMCGPPLEGELYGLEPVGWFRAQPGRRLAASPWELELLNTLFTEERQVGMMFRPDPSGAARARFYIRERDGFLPDFHRELVVPAAAAGPILTVEPETIRRESRPEPPVEAPARPTAKPRTPDLELLSRQFADMVEEEPPGFADQARGWVWRALSSLALFALVLGYWWWTSIRPQPVPAVSARQPDVLAEADRRQIPLGDTVELPATARQDFAPDSITLTPPPPNPDPGSAPNVNPPALSQAEIDRLTKPVQKAQTPPPPVPPRQPEAAPLRPLRLPQTAAQPTAKTPDLAPAPLVAREAPPPSVIPLPQSITIVPPPKKAPVVAVPGPSRGTLIWTGRLRKNATLVIDGRTASAGTLTGELPGKPVQVTVYPGDLGDNGILVFTARPQDARVGWDPAGPQNGWNRVMYEFDPHNASGIEVAEAPSPGNAWKRLVLRCNNPKLSVIYVKWSLAR